MAFVTYLYLDPKTSVPRYVGKGLETRPREHFRPSTDTRLGRMLRKRVREGFDPQPLIIQASSEADAFEMEQLLIEMIGRKDLNKGPLFNRTNGGEGSSGSIASSSKRNAISLAHKARSEDQRAKYIQALSEGVTRFHEQRSTDKKTQWSSKMKAVKQKPCTVDGVTIFKSRLDLAASLGFGKTGTRSPTFQYV